MKKTMKIVMSCIFSALTFLNVGCGEKITHTHNWSEEWTHDGVEHWHACAECDEKKDAASHTGGVASCTEKAVCEICGIAYGEEPTHPYEWHSDAEKHWQECSVCGDVKADSEGAHTG
ncbi:MAG: hypothetical protein J6K86_00285, partial [Clostridia bacterium]|nr:hypothetical protein [Clostridia bacterium]